MEKAKTIERKSELILAIACAVGTDNTMIKAAIKEALAPYHYQVEEIKISKDVIEPTLTVDDKADFLNTSENGEVELKSREARTHALMTKGNELRVKGNERYKDYSILANGVVLEINTRRKKIGEEEPEYTRGIVYIIDSLKHEDEVIKLRQVYSSIFFLIAVNEPFDDRESFLLNIKNVPKEAAEELCDRDIDEGLPYGQHTSKVFEMADFHLSLYDWDNNKGKGKQLYNKKDYIEKISKQKLNILHEQIERILCILFGNPFMTPTFEEHAMFMAYATARHSADLSRQVGAAIARDGEQLILATGSNDVPKFPGGQYWQDGHKQKENYWDEKEGRDYLLTHDNKKIIGYDPNKDKYDELMNNFINDMDFTRYEENMDTVKSDFRKTLNKYIGKMTEYNRAVHAEMAAMLTCARLGISLQDATLYATTFPCHNCARHAIFCGIKRVVFIEPYPKSVALDLHRNAISVDLSDLDEKVIFMPFKGVGPRRYFDLFALDLSTGYKKTRKKSNRIDAAEWDPGTSKLRCGMPYSNYRDVETDEATIFLMLIAPQNQQT